MRKTALRRASKKRAKEARTYSKLRKEFLNRHEVCEVFGLLGKVECLLRATEIHHKAGRGKNYLNVETWLPVCTACHAYIEAHKKWSRENGYITYK